MAAARGTVEPDGIAGELFPLGAAPVERPEGAVRRGGQKADERFQDESNAPGGLPQFGVKGAEGQADFGVGFEATGFGEEYNVWRFEGILGWQQDAAVVDSTGKVRVVGSADRKVPVDMWW